jgi:hypothetical protein
MEYVELLMYKNKKLTGDKLMTDKKLRQVVEYIIGTCIFLFCVSAGTFVVYLITESSNK